MVKLVKETIPNSLRLHSEAWTNELLEQYEENDCQASRVQEKYWVKYRKDDIKVALSKENFNKCMYCDTRIGIANYGHIEHIKPKKRNPHLTYIWDNLGWCCEICNNKKRENELLNPYEVDLDDKLSVALSLMLIASSDEDFETEFFISQLDLNGRVDLVAKRCQECYQFESKLKKMKTMYEKKDPNIDKYMLIMRNEFNNDKEYYIFKKFVFKNFIEINEIKLEGTGV